MNSSQFAVGSPRSARLAPLFEKHLHQLPALRFAHTLDDGDSMIVAWQLRASHRRYNRAGPRLRGTEHERADPRVDQRADTHQARLDRDADDGAGQAVVADSERGS